MINRGKADENWERKKLICSDFVHHEPHRNLRLCDEKPVTNVLGYCMYSILIDS
jgi:hypothetical protein